MYITEIIFKQTEATMIESMKTSEGKRCPEVMNIKVKFWNDEVGSTLTWSARPTSYHKNTR